MLIFLSSCFLFEKSKGTNNSTNKYRGGRVQSQDDRTARLAGGVRAVQSRSGHAQRALYVVGGTSLLLPLFAQLEPTQKNLKNPKTTTSSTGIVVSLDTENAKEKEKKDISGDGSEDMVYDEALELMMFVLQLLVGESGTLLMDEMHHLLATVPTISVLLHSRSPQVLTSGFLGSVLLFVRDVLPVRPTLAHQIIREVLLDFGLWSRTSFDVQRQLVHLLYGLDSEFPSLLADSCGVQRLLDMTQIAYCRVTSAVEVNVQTHPKEASECAVKAVELIRRMFSVDRNGRDDERMAANMMAESQGREPYGNTSLDDQTVDSEIFLNELNALLCFVRCCSGSPPGKAAAAAALHMVQGLLDDPHSRKSTYDALQTLGGAAEIVPLVSRPGANARIAAIGVLGRVLAESRRIVLKFQQNRSNNNNSSIYEEEARNRVRSGSGGGGGGGSGGGSGGSNVDMNNVAVAAQAAASLYGCNQGNTGVTTMLDVNSLPSEAKPALMVRIKATQEQCSCIYR